MMTIDSAAYRTAAEHLARAVKLNSMRSGNICYKAVLCLSADSAASAGVHELTGWRIWHDSLEGGAVWLVQAARIRLLLEAWWAELPTAGWSVWEQANIVPGQAFALVEQLMAELEPHAGTPPGGKDEG